VSVADPDGDAIASLTADLSQFPAAASFSKAADNKSGTVSWTTGFSDGRAAAYVATFTAQNTRTGTATGSVTVSDADRAPVVIVTPPSQTVQEGQTASIGVSVADPDGDAITSLTADLSQFPAAASFSKAADNKSGTVSWTPGFSDGRVAAYVATFTAQNARTGTATGSVTVTNVDRAPVVTVTPPSQTVAEGQTASMAITATDPDGDAISSLDADLSGFPASAVFSKAQDNKSATITWPTGFADGRVAPYVATITAKNALTGSASGSVTVPNADRQPIVTVVTPSVIVEETHTVTLTVLVSDPDGDAITTLDALTTGFPAGTSFTRNLDNTVGTFTWTPGFDDGRQAPYVVTFRAANDLVGTATGAITVSTVDRAPVVAVTAPPSVSAGQTVTFQVGVSDPDGDAISTLVPDLSGLPSGANTAFIANGTNTVATLTWTPTAQDVRPTAYLVTFRAVNALIGSATAAVTVTRPDHAPVVTLPAPYVFGASNTPLVVNASAYDPDGDPITSMKVDLGGLPAGNNAVFVPNPGNLGGTLLWTPGYADARQAPYLIKFTAANGLSGSETATVSVAPVDGPPVVTLTPASLTVAPGRAATIGVSVADPNGDAIDLLRADFAGLPSANNAVFIKNATNNGGTLTWTPTVQDVRSTPYTVPIMASNSLFGTASASITVASVDGPPAATVTAVAIPKAIALKQISPNPFRISIQFAIDLPQAERVDWSMIGPDGRRLFAETRHYGAGRHVWEWDGRTALGSRAAPGIYFLVARTGGVQFTRRVVKI
jgi:hypothetical protein